MAKTINLRKLNAMFNAYLKTNDASFIDFMRKNGYINGDSLEFSDNAIALRDAELLFDKTQPNKYAEYLLFLANNKKEVLAKDKVAEANFLAEKIATYFLTEKIALNLSNEDAEFVMKELAIGSKKVTTEKSHPKWRWFTKKVLVPAVIGVGIGVCAGLGLGLAGLAIGAVPFVSESIGYTLQAYTLIGALVAGVATPAIINTKDKIVDAHHKRKLNGKESLEMLMENLDSDELTLEEINELPVTKFLNSYLALDAKLIDAKENTVRKHPVLWAKRYGDRNKLHAIYDFTKELSEQIEEGKKLVEKPDVKAKDIVKYLYSDRKTRKQVLADENVDENVLLDRLFTAINRQEGLLNYINQELHGDIVENFIAYKKGSDKKFRMADIDVKHGKGYKSKEKDVAVINELVKPIYKQTLTTGFGPVEEAGHGTEKHLVALAQTRETKRLNKESVKTQKAEQAKQNAQDKENSKLQAALKDIKTNATTSYSKYINAPTKANFNSFVAAQTKYVDSFTDYAAQQNARNELKEFENSRIEAGRMERYNAIQKAHSELKSASRAEKDNKNLSYIQSQISYLEYIKFTKSVEEQKTVQTKITELKEKETELKEKLAKRAKSVEPETPKTDTIPETTIPLFARRTPVEEKTATPVEKKPATSGTSNLEFLRSIIAQRNEKLEKSLDSEKAEQERKEKEAEEARKAEEARLLAEKTARLEQENAKLKAEQERLQKEAEEKAHYEALAEQLRKNAEAEAQNQDKVSFSTRERTQAEKDLAKAKSNLRKAQAKAGEVIGIEEELKKELSEAADETQQKEINVRLNKNVANRAKVSQKITELKAEIERLQAVVEQEKAAATNNSNND